MGFVKSFKDIRWYVIKRSRAQNKSITKQGKNKLIIGSIIAANFLVFIIGAVLVGGEALSGFVLNGRYFMFDGLRKTYIETSKTIWLISRYHGISMICTNILGLSILLALEKKNKCPKSTLMIGVIVLFLLLFGILTRTNKI